MTKFNVGDKVRFIDGYHKGEERVIAEWTKDYGQPKDVYQFTNGLLEYGRNLELIEPATPKFNVGDKVRFIEGSLKGEERVIAEWTFAWNQPDNGYQFTNGNWAHGSRLELVEAATPKFNVGDKVRFINGGWKREIVEWTRSNKQPKDAYQFTNGNWAYGKNLELIEPAQLEYIVINDDGNRIVSKPDALQMVSDDPLATVYELGRHVDVICTETIEFK